jgi:opacity protein-like surface antigen
MKKALILTLAALVVPSAALAAKPAHGGPKPPKKPHMVTYVVHGTLSGYTAYDASTSTNGSITILVKHANKHGYVLKGQSLTFAVDANTKLHLAAGLTTVTDGDRGGISLRAPKKIAAADLVATLQLSPASQIHDNGVKKPKS